MLGVNAAILTVPKKIAMQQVISYTIYIIIVICVYRKDTLSTDRFRSETANVAKLQNHAKFVVYITLYVQT